MFKNCANLHNNLADRILKEEPKYYLLNRITLHTQMLLSRTVKENEEQTT